MAGETLTFDGLRVGTVYPKVSYRFDARQVARWLGLFGDDDAVYVTGDAALAAGLGDGPVIPPALTSLYIIDAYMRNYVNRPPGGIHARQEFVWYRPVRVGEEIITEVTLADKFIKRGRRYVMSATRTENAGGHLVAAGLMTTIWAR